MPHAEPAPLPATETTDQPIVLPEGLEVPTAVVLSEHRDLTELLDLYHFLADAYTGEGGFAPWFGAYLGTKIQTEGTPFEDRAQSWNTTGNKLVVSYITPHKRESTLKYRRRWEKAHYTNYIEWLVRIWAGVLTRHPPKRENYPPPVRAWIDAQDYDLWVKRERVPWGLVNGRLFTLINTPLDGDGPELALIQPTAVLDWLVDSDGLKAIKYRVPHNPTEDLLHPREPVDRVWVLNREGWYFFEISEKERRGALQGSKGLRNPATGAGQGREISTVKVKGSGLWDGQMKGKLPVLEFRRGVEARSAVFFQAQICRRLFNLDSLLTEIEDLTAFPLLAIQNSNSDDNRRALIGASVAINVPEDARLMPQYVTYDAGPHGVLSDRTTRLVKQLKQLAALTIGDSDQAGRTGIASAYEFFLTGATLADFASDFEEAERQDMDVVARWLGLDGMPDNATVRWDTNFDLVEAKNQMMALDAALAMDPGPLARAEIIKRAVKAVVGDLPEEQIREICEQIDEMSMEDVEPETPPPEPPAMGGIPEADIEAVER